MDFYCLGPVIWGFRKTW